MQKAYEADMGVINQDGSIDYVDSPEATQQDESNTVPVEATPVQDAPADDFAAIMEG